MSITTTFIQINVISTFTPHINIITQFKEITIITTFTYSSSITTFTKLNTNHCNLGAPHIVKGSNFGYLVLPQEI